MADRTRRAGARKTTRPPPKKKKAPNFLARLPWARIFGTVATFGTMILVVLVWGGMRRESVPAEEPVLPPPPIRREAPRQETSLGLPQREVRPAVAVVLDDAGYSLSDLQPFLELPFPVAIAILPFQPHSRTSLERVLASGKTAMLHMPMQPLGNQDPGEGALLLSDTPEGLMQKLTAAIESLPGITGVNNHMGSGLTSNREAMRVVVAEVERRGLFFLDSFTHADSQALAAAEDEGIPILRRDVFADHTDAEADMQRALEQTLEIASRNGSGVVIGHVWSPMLAGKLRSLYEDNRNRFRFVSPKELIE